MTGVQTCALPISKNAALLAAQILAVEDMELAQKLKARREADASKVLEKNRGIEERYNNFSKRID